MADPLRTPTKDLSADGLMVLGAQELHSQASRLPTALTLVDYVQELTETAKRAMLPKDCILKLRGLFSVASSAEVTSTGPLKTAGYNLWNLTLLMEKKYPLQFVADLKQLSCDILGLCAVKQPFNYELCLDLLKLLTSSGTVWTNLQQDCHRQAAACFGSAIAYWKQILKFIPQPPVSASSAAFQMHLCHAKSHWKFGMNEEALASMGCAKELSTDDRSNEQWCITAYNFAVHCFRDKHYGRCCQWALFSYEHYKGDDKAKPARTLRLLSTGYLELEDYPTALRYVGLALELEDSAQGIYLQTRLLILNRESERLIEASFSNLAAHPDCTVNMYLLLCDFAWKHECNSIAAKKYAELQDSDKGAANMERVLVCKFEFMMAKKLYEDICHEVQELMSSPKNKASRGLQAVHSLLFNKATELSEMGNSSTAKLLFETTLRLIPDDDCKSIAMTQRWIVRCCIEQGDLSEGQTWLSRAENHDATAIQQSYLSIVLSLAETPDKTLSKLKAFIEKVSTKVENQEEFALLLEVVAEEARQAGKLDVAICSLTSLIDTSKVKRAPGRLAVTARHIVSLLLQTQRESGANEADVSSWEKTLSRVAIEGEIHGFKELFGSHEDCFEYLVATSWNLGLQFFRNSSYDNSARIICCCLKLLQLRPGSNHKEMKASCLFLKALALVESSDQDKSGTKAEEILKTALELRKLLAEGSLEELSASLNMPGLIFSCEFAATCVANPSGIPPLVQRTMVAPGMTPEVLEAVANMAKSHDREGAIAILKHAKQMCLADPRKNANSMGRIFRSLMSLADSNDNKRALFEEFVALSEASSSIFPTEDIRWCCLMAWNTGVQHFRTSKSKLAEQWMGLALKLASMLNNEPYEGTMLEGYREVLRSTQSQSA